jgi:hypothetical protein
MVSLRMVILSMPWVYSFVPGSAASQPPSPPKPPAASRQADYKVVVWFRGDRPLETFQYVTYDIRKGQYTKAVDSWLEMIRTKYPSYEVSVRDVDLSREKGETEALKVGAVIKRELMAAAAREGIFLGREVPGRLPRLLTPGLGAPGGTRTIGRPPPIRPPPSRPVELSPPPPTFPIPVPYPRMPF